MPFADELLGPDVVTRLTDSIARAAPAAALPGLGAAADALGPLGLRERTDLLKDALLDDLPGSPEDLERVVRTCLRDDGFTGWLIWPVSEAVAARAVQDGRAEAFDAALALLADLTPRLTSEFALRTLLDADLARALPIVRTWTAHPDEHVRRLASEGTRPFLPWSRRVRAILADPPCTLPILDALYRDPSELVRRSVANHLNDLSRENADLVVAIAARWAGDPDGHTALVVRHGLRTLVKRGHPGALALLGFAPPTDVVVTGPVLGATSVTVGQDLPFDVTLENTGGGAVKVAVDYVVHHRKANGTQTAKVFKLTTTTLAPGQVVTVVPAPLLQAHHHPALPRRRARHRGPGQRHRDRPGVLPAPPLNP